MKQQKLSFFIESYGWRNAFVKVKPLIGIYYLKPKDGVYMFKIFHIVFGRAWVFRW